MSHRARRSANGSSAHEVQDMISTRAQGHRRPADRADHPDVEPGGALYPLQTYGRSDTVVRSALVRPAVDNGRGPDAPAHLRPVSTPRRQVDRQLAHST